MKSPQNQTAKAATGFMISTQINLDTISAGQISFKTGKVGAASGLPLSAEMADLPRAFPACRCKPRSERLGDEKLASLQSRAGAPERLRLFDDFESPLLGRDSLRPPPPLSPKVGVDRHSRVRAMMRKEGVTGLIAVSTPEDTQAGDYLSGSADGFWGSACAIVYLPVDGEPFAFAPPELTPLFPAIVILAKETAGGSPCWVKDWMFGKDGIPTFAGKLGDRIRRGAVVGGVNLIGTPLGDYLQTELPDLGFKELGAQYNEVRAIKAGEEIASVRSACAATEAIAEMLTKTIVDGASEAAVMGTVRCNIGRHGVVMGDVPLASFDGFGAPIAPASIRNISVVGNSFDSTWRSRGMPPRILKHGQLISLVARCWSGGTEGHLHLSVSIGKLTGERQRIATLLEDTLQRSCDMIKPGVRLNQINDSISDGLDLTPDSISPYCYILNPTQNPDVGDIVLQEGMHVHLNPYFVGKEMTLGVGCGLLVTAGGAEKLNDISCKVQTV